MDIEQLQQFCLGLPKVTEDVKWENHLVFSIGGKMFCMASLDDRFTCSFKVSKLEFDELSHREGIQPAPYLARAQWVQLTRPSALNRQEWEKLIRNSYELVKQKLAKKIRMELGI